MVALVRGIPCNLDDITMKTSHVDKMDTGLGCILWSSWAPLGGITEELEGVLCCGQSRSLRTDMYKLCLENFLWVTGLLSSSLGRLLMKVQQKFPVWGVLLVF